MKHRRLFPLAFLLVLMIAPVFVIPQNMTVINPTHNPVVEQDMRVVDIGNGEFIELAPNEELHRFVLTDQGWTEWSDISSPLIGAEFGNSTNILDDTQMTYVPGSGTTDFTAEIPTGTDWEAYEAQVSITDLTENRTWIQNPGFDTGTGSWTLVTTSSAGYSTVSATYDANGHGAGNGAVEVEIDSDSGGAPYYYDNNDQAWAR